MSLSWETCWCAREAGPGRITVLLSDHLANICFLANKIKEVLFLSSKDPELYQTNGLHFTEIRLSEHFLDRTPHLQGLQLLQGGGITEHWRGPRSVCFIIHQHLCIDVMEMKTMSSPHLENFFIYCRSHLSSFVLVSIYILLQM